MPNIAEYNATGEITPSDRGIQAAEIAGRRIGESYSQLGRAIGGVFEGIERHQSLVEISNATRHMSDAELNMEAQWDQMRNDPNNKGVNLLPAFQEHVKNTIDELQSHLKTEAGQMHGIQLGDQIYRSLIRKAMADQSAHDGEVVQENAEKVGNNAGVSIARDPSQANWEAQVKQINDTADIMASAMHMPAGEESRAMEWKQNYITRHMHDAVVTRYQSMAQSISQQIEQTGDPSKSPAYADAQKTYAGDTQAQDYVDGKTWTALGEGLERAKQQGMERFKAGQETVKSAQVDAGKQAYSNIHNIITNLALAGKGPTPEVVRAADAFRQRFGATNPGEVSALDDFIIRGQDRATEGKVQPFNQATRDTIQAHIFDPQGSPNRITLPDLQQAYSHGLITPEDLSHYTEMIDKRDHPEKDPTYTPAFDALKRWQNAQKQAIGAKGAAGLTAAQSAFIHDSTVQFMTLGRAVGWDKALDAVTNDKNPGSFARMLGPNGPYAKAALRPDAGDWLHRNWATWEESGNVTIPPGAVGNEFFPRRSNTAPSPRATTPVQAPAQKASDLNKADQIIWGKP